MGDTGLACEFKNAIVGDTPDMGGCIQLPCIIPSCIITGLAWEDETEHGLETINLIINNKTKMLSHNFRHGAAHRHIGRDAHTRHQHTKYSPLSITWSCLTWRSTDPGPVPLTHPLPVSPSNFISLAHGDLVRDPGPTDPVPLFFRGWQADSSHCVLTRVSPPNGTAES